MCIYHIKEEIVHPRGPLWGSLSPSVVLSASEGC